MIAGIKHRLNEPTAAEGQGDGRHRLQRLRPVLLCPTLPPASLAVQRLRPKMAENGQIVTESRRFGVLSGCPEALLIALGQQIASRVPRVVTICPFSAIWHPRECAQRSPAMRKGPATKARTMGIAASPCRAERAGGGGGGGAPPQTAPDALRRWRRRGEGGGGTARGTPPASPCGLGPGRPDGSGAAGPEPRSGGAGQRRRHLLRKRQGAASGAALAPHSRSGTTVVP